MNLHSLGEKYPEKRSIITGANSGIGFEILNMLLDNDWSILAIDMDCSELNKKKNYPNLTICQLDVSNSLDFKNAIDNFCQCHAGVDILFNNAGVGEGVRFEDYSLENWDWIISINLKAVIAGCQFVFDYMKNQSHGLIVNMASAAGYANLPNMSPYNVTKAGVISLSETLGYEFEPFNVQVQCVTPTFFQSNILRNSRGSSDILQSARRLVNSSGMNSHDAACILLKSLHRKQKVLRFPFNARFLSWFKRYFPGIFGYAIRKFLMKHQ